MKRNSDRSGGSPRVDAVIFDMDGLLIDSEPLYQIAWQRAAAELGFELTDTLNRRLIGKSEPASLQMLSATFGAGFAPDRFITLCARHWEAHVSAHGIALKPGVEDLLDLLDREAIPRAVATSSHRRNARLSLECTGLFRRVETVVTGDQIANGKPAPDIYLEAARRLGVAPRTCLAFEDSEPGLLAATAAGMTTFLVPDLGEASAEARSQAYGVLPSLEPALAILGTLIGARAR